MGVEGFWKNPNNTTSQHNHKVKTEGAAILLQESEIQNIGGWGNVDNNKQM